MPAFSFKEQFVPFVKDGSKPGTIRAARKQIPRVGQLAHLYYAMRTKYCTKLVEDSPTIRSINGIYIGAKGEVAIMDVVITKDNEADLLHYMNLLPKTHCLGAKLTWLTKKQKDALAWHDGFRSPDHPHSHRGCFDLMVKFWELPVISNYHLWGATVKEVITPVK